MFPNRPAGYRKAAYKQEVLSAHEANSYGVIWTTKTISTSALEEVFAATFLV